MDIENSLKAQGVLVVITIVVLALVVNFVFAFGTVEESEVAVETHWGEATGASYESGSYLLGMGSGLPIPNGISHSTERISVEPITMTQTSDSISKDGQDISAKVSVTYRVRKDEAVSFYSDSENSAPFRSTQVWEDRIGQRAVQSAVRNGVSSVSAMEMVENFDSEDGENLQTLRSQLRTELNDQLTQETEKVSPEIEIVEVRVEDIALSQSLDTGLEDIAVKRTEAEQQLIEAEGEAAARRAQAEGEADAFNTVVQAYGNEDRALQSEWIEAINEDEGTIVIDAEAAPILDLNERQQQQTQDSD